MFDKLHIEKLKNKELHYKSITKEIQILRQLDNPIQIQLNEVYQSENKLYLVMEYLEGPELFQHILKFGPYKEKDACHIFKQLLHSI